MACSFGVDGGEEPSQPQQVATQVPPPTQPAETEAPEPEPTEELPPPTAEPVSQQFFTDEFDTPLSSDWNIFTITASDKADADKVTVEVEDGRLVWDFDSEYLYYYLFYNAFEYEDVRVDVRADNLGRNNNNVSLICRYDPEVGWYEFNIANNGLYDIYYAEVRDNGKIAYNRITNGGSNAIKQGKDVNEYSITCEGEDLTLNINGDEVNTITERKYSLRRGQVGVSVSSFNVLPILVEMDWIKVSEP
jgi:hypothetical protein